MLVRGFTLTQHISLEGMNGAWSWQEKLKQGVPVLLNVAFLSAASPLKSSGGAFHSYGLHYQARLTSSFTSSNSSSMWKERFKKKKKLKQFQFGADSVHWTPTHVPVKTIFF